MDKYNNIVYISKIQKCLESGDREEALRLAEKVNRRKLKDVYDINILAEAYYVNKYYTQAKELYEQIYGTTSSKRALSRLINVSIKIKAVSEAEYYLGQYENIAGTDSNRWIYRYQLEKISGSSMARLIELLENLKAEDYYEKWAYELAKLYHKCGRKEDCINECKDIILWFGEGEYVEWAKALIGVLNGDVDINELEAVSAASSAQKKSEEVISSDNEASPVEDLQEPSEEDTEELMFSEDSENEERKQGFFRRLTQKWKSHIVRLDDSLEKEFDEKYSEADSMENTQFLSETVNDRPSEEDIPETEEAESKENKAEYEENEVSCDDTFDGKNMDEMEMSRAIFESVMQNTGRYCPVNISELSSESENVDDYGRLAQVLESLDMKMDKAFGAFANISSVGLQLKRTMNTILSEKRRSINLIIAGPQKSGKTTLAKRIITLLYKAGGIKTNDVARTTAEKVNKMNLREKVGQLADKVFLIEGAGALNRKSVETLLELSSVFFGKTSVVLEDSAENIDNLLRDNPELNGLYNHRIDLPDSYSEENLAGFAHRFISDKGYNIDVSANEQLKKAIGRIIEKHEANRLAVVNGLSNCIYEAAEKRNAEALCDMAKKGSSICTDFTTIIKEDIIEAEKEFK